MTQITLFVKQSRLASWISQAAQVGKLQSVETENSFTVPCGLEAAFRFLLSCFVVNTSCFCFAGHE